MANGGEPGENDLQHDTPTELFNLGVNLLERRNVVPEFYNNGGIGMRLPLDGDDLALANTVLTNHAIEIPDRLTIASAQDPQEWERHIDKLFVTLGYTMTSTHFIVEITNGKAKPRFTKEIISKDTQANIDNFMKRVHIALTDLDMGVLDPKDIDIDDKDMEALGLKDVDPNEQAALFELLRALKK